MSSVLTYQTVLLSEGDKVHFLFSPMTCDYAKTEIEGSILLQSIYSLFLKTRKDYGVVRKPFSWLTASTWLHHKKASIILWRDPPIWKSSTSPSIEKRHFIYKSISICIFIPTLAHKHTCLLKHSRSHLSSFILSRTPSHILFYSHTHIRAHEHDQLVWGQRICIPGVAYAAVLDRC